MDYTSLFCIKCLRIMLNVVYKPQKSAVSLHPSWGTAAAKRQDSEAAERPSYLDRLHLVLFQEWRTQYLKID